jgi:hypothetical protein
MHIKENNTAIKNKKAAKITKKVLMLAKMLSVVIPIPSRLLGIGYF